MIYSHQHSLKILTPRLISIGFLILRGASINDVTQIWRFADSPPSSVTLNCLFYLGLHTECHKSVNPAPPFLCDVINEHLSSPLVYLHWKIGCNLSPERWSQPAPHWSWFCCNGRIWTSNFARTLLIRNSDQTDHFSFCQQRSEQYQSS